LNGGQFKINICELSRVVGVPRAFAAIWGADNMKLPKNVVRVGAIASFLVATGVSSDVHALNGLGALFTLSFPGASYTATAGQSVTASFIATAGGTVAGSSWNALLPECCVPGNEPLCRYSIAETGSLADADGTSQGEILGNGQLPSSATPGRTLTYHVTLFAHCSFISSTFAVVSQHPQATAAFRVTSK
jgi:hypothetical protein